MCVISTDLQYSGSTIPDSQEKTEVSIPSGPFYKPLICGQCQEWAALRAAVDEGQGDWGSAASLQCTLQLYCIVMHCRRSTL